MLLPMPEVVLQMIALGFQRIVVFVLPLPAGAPRRHNISDGFLGARRLGHEGILLEAGALRGSDRELTPIDVHGIGGGPQGELHGIAIGIDSNFAHLRVNFSELM